jgi:hypothetical protein
MGNISAFARRQKKTKSDVLWWPVAGPSRHWPSTCSAVNEKWNHCYFPRRVYCCDILHSKLHCISTLKNNWLKLFSQMIALCCVNYMKRTIQAWRTGCPVERQSFYPSIICACRSDKNSIVKVISHYFIVSASQSPPPSPLHFRSSRSTPG